MPFNAPSALALALRHLTEPGPPPRALRPDLAVWLERVVLQCLEKEPQRRFASAAALAAELRKSRSDTRLRSRRLPTGDAVLEDQSQGVVSVEITLTHGHQSRGGGHGVSLGKRESLPLPGLALRKSLNS